MLTVLFMLFVSLGCTSGGLWFDYGNHQLLCHCHHMGTELLTPSGPPAPFPKLSTRAKKGKSVPKKLNTG